MLNPTASSVALLAASWWDYNAGAVGLAGLIITTVGLIATGIFFLLQRDKKTFDWQLLTDEQIITSAASRTTGGITVLLNGTVPLEHPRLLTVRLVNTGKREIRPEDFDGFVIIKTAPGLELRIADAIRKRDGMRNFPDCYWELDECHVGPLLYNRGDWIDIQLLVDHALPVPQAVNIEQYARELVAAEADAAVRPRQPVTVDSVIAGQTRRGRRIAYETRTRQMRSAFLSGVATAIATSVVFTIATVAVRYFF